MTPTDPVRAALRGAIPAEAGRVLEVAPDADPSPPVGRFDCVALADVLERVADPVAALRAYRASLAPGGVVVAAVANVQHHAVVAALLRGEFPWQAPRRFFTYATALKAFLDAGFAPDIVAAVPSAVPTDLLEALRPAFVKLGLHPARTSGYLAAGHYILRGTPVDDADDAPEEPLTFVACVSDDALLAANLLASPDLGPGSPHEVLLFRGCRSAADGLNAGVARARHALVVGVHQDVYLPAGWARRFAWRVRAAEQAVGPVGVAGVYGITRGAGGFARAGHILDRDRRLCERVLLPSVVGSLDEVVLAVPRDGPVRFDPELGFHFYGTDACLQAARAGRAAVAVDALCLHNSLSVGLPEDFAQSGAVLARKWADRLPLATSCVTIDRAGRLTEW